MRSGGLSLRCSLPSRLHQLGFAVIPALIVLASGCDNDPQAPDATALSTDPAVAAASATLLTWRQVSTGSLHTCGVTNNDLAYCWGSNTHGQLGDRTTEQRNRPVRVAGGLRFRLVSAGDYHTCGLTTGNRAYCWGWNYQGALGTGTTQRISKRPLAVAGDRRFRDLSAGYFHACAVTYGDRALCWGSNGVGQVGDGKRLSRWTPVRVAGELSFRSVSAGADHTCGVTTTNVAYCWGLNEYGDLGDGTTAEVQTRPTPVAGGHSFHQVFAGDRHSCGATTANAAYCWGWNLYGQVGDGSRLERRTPAAVIGGHAFTGASAGGAHSCAVRIDQGVWCWGRNSFGQLGNGTTADYTVPVSAGGSLRFRQIETGTSHSCGVGTDNRAYCWGYGGAGQTGDGAASPTNSLPEAVAEPS